MPDTTAAAPAPAPDRRNVFLDDASDRAERAGADHVTDATLALSVAAPTEPDHDVGESLFGEGRTRARRHYARLLAVRFPAWAAIAAIAAVAIALLTSTLSSSGDRRRGTDAARPTAAPPAAARSPHRQIPDAPPKPRPRPEPTSGSDPRPRLSVPTERTCRAGRRDRTRARSGSRPVAPAPVPSVTPEAPPSPRPDPPPARALPAPVPADAPPEFM